MNAAEAIGEAAGEVTVATQFVPTCRPPFRRVTSCPRQAGPVRSADGDRYRAGHSAGRAGADVRPVLHDQVRRPRAGAGRGARASCVPITAAIRVSPEPGRGTTVEALWPVVDVARPHRQRSRRRRHRAGRALVVDDEMFVREVTASTVRGAGYEPLLAGDGRRPWSCSSSIRDEIRVAVLDVVMPGMTRRRVAAANSGRLAPRCRRCW